MIKDHPELFPASIHKGYTLKDCRLPQKLLVLIRRIEIPGEGSFSIRPSFVMPSMTGFTSEVEKGLFLRKFNVPFWALAHVFGRDPMYWYRLECALGRNSIVGTTVKSPDKLPKDLLADEKHTTIKGEKVYIATTVGKECILGAAVAQKADTGELSKAYLVFKEEALDVDPNYQPKTVNVDGWQATSQAWSKLFPGIAIILCFLHAFLKIRDRAKKKFAEVFTKISDKVWEAYKAPTKRTFSQRIRRLKEWATQQLDENIVKEQVLKLCSRKKEFLLAYDHPHAHRTSNMLDRLMKFMDQHLFDTQYFHGSAESAQLQIRSWALLWNFCPSSPETIKKHGGKISPAERLNGFRYHDNWLPNLLVSASMGGFRSKPQNPL